MSEIAVEEPPLQATAWTVAPAPAAARVRIHRVGTVRHDLRASVGDATFCGVMVGTGETYLPAFVLAAGLGEFIAGLVASLPQLAGGIAQLVSPWAVRRLGSHRRWVVLCVTIQAASFVPLVVAAWMGTVSPGVALMVATLYWSAGLAASAPWNTWMGTIVPRIVRPRYFAFRTRFQQSAVLAGFLLSGAAIHWGATPLNPLGGFALLFAMAAGCRLLSAGFLARTSEPEPLPGHVKHIPLPELLRRFGRGAESQRLLYIALVQGAAYVAGPYFAPYMFRVLGFSSLQYVALISTAYVAKVVSVSLFGSVAARFGVRRLLWIGGIGLVPVAGMWLVSDRFWYLVFVQLCAGTAWAAYELAVFLVTFNSIRPEERTSILTLFNLSTTAAMVVGSLLGGALLELFGPTRSVYYVLFAGSSLLRLSTLLFLRRIPARLIEGSRARPIVNGPRLIAVERPTIEAAAAQLPAA